MGITGDQSRSERPDNKPSRHRRLGRWGKAGIALAILVVALTVLASQQGGDSGSSGPLNAIAQAAEKTQSEPGGRVAMRAIVSEDGSKPNTMRGQMVFDDEDRSRAVMTVSPPGSAETFQINMVTEGTMIYMSSPRFRSLPDGNKWMGLDLDFALEQGQESLIPGNPDAEGELEMLEGVSDDIRQLGKEDVRGAPTTRYSGTIAVAEQAKRMRDLGADEIAGRFEKEASPAEVEVWIDAKGLVRRMRIVQTAPQVDDGGTTTTDMRMDFFDLGIDPEIDVPDSDEVFDATAITEEELSKH
jgi:hypothetical protein